MNAIKRGKGKNKGYWTWMSESHVDSKGKVGKALYREPIREGQAPNALNRRRVREMKGG